LTGTAGIWVEGCAGRVGLVVEVALDDPAQTARLAPRAAVTATAAPATMTFGRILDLLFVVGLILRMAACLSSSRLVCVFDLMMGLDPDADPRENH
jgi:hypothetical protein